MTSKSERTKAGVAGSGTAELPRRHFFAATLAAAGAALVGKPSAEAADAAPQQPERRLTYRETDHVRAFYRRSRF